MRSSIHYSIHNFANSSLIVLAVELEQQLLAL